MNYMELIRQRYSCRRFTDRPVEPEKVETIIEAGRLAPTATNAQPVRIWVIRSEEALEKARTVTRCHFDAPVLFVIGGRADGAWVRQFDGRNFADVDASIVATQMMLAVEELGLGTTWVGWFDAPKLQEMFPVMQGYDLVAMFPVGYPAADAVPAPKHSLRLSRNEIAEDL